MTNLIDIPTVVNTLITYFAMGGTDAAIEAIKGITVNATIKLSELKDQLLCKPKIKQATEEMQKNPLNLEIQQHLKDILTQELKEHSAFKNKTSINIIGDVSAESKSVAVGVSKNSNISIINND